MSEAVTTAATLKKNMQGRKNVTDTGTRKYFLKYREKRKREMILLCP